MSPRRSFFLVMAGAVVVASATACERITAPEDPALDDMPVRDTTGFIVKMPPIQPRG